MKATIRDSADFSNAQYIHHNLVIPALGESSHDWPRGGSTISRKPPILTGIAAPVTLAPALCGTGLDGVRIWAISIHKKKLQEKL